MEHVPGALEKLFVARSKRQATKGDCIVDLYGMSAKYDEITISKLWCSNCGGCGWALLPFIRGSSAVADDYLFFSFNGNKIITSSGSGMLCASNKNR